MERPKIITVVGPNASGKSALGIKLAKRFNGEIISADSRQVYRGFDLCCGKVTEEEKEEIPHYLLDVRNVGEPFSVCDYQKMAYSSISQIMAKGKVPFIVGGTGLYVRAVVRGYNFEEDSFNTELREKLEKLSLEELQEMLSPDSKAFLSANPSDFNNKRRLIRRIEKDQQGEGLNHNNEPRYDVLQLGISWPKEILHQRIEERLETRIAQGMLEEVKEYLDQGGKPEVLESLGLEYRYILWYLTGKYEFMDEFKAELAREIKHLAKRQMTYFRPDKSIHWLDMSGDYFEQAQLLIKDFFGGEHYGRC